VPFCVQYSFNLDGIIKEKKFSHNITVTYQAVKFTRRKSHDAGRFTNAHFLNARMNFGRCEITDYT